jgi:acetyl esterase/lipase
VHQNAPDKTLQFGAVHGEPVWADFYLPNRAAAADARCPALILVSGGGWLRGSRSMLAEWGRFLASLGYAAVSIDYRQSVNGPSYPQNARDVRAAQEWLYAEAASHGIDRNRIGLLGVSSGAHLAALTALTSTVHPISTLITVYGIFDLEAHWHFEKRRTVASGIPLTEKMMGYGPSGNRRSYKRASPLGLVDPKRAEGLKALVIWGCDDDVVAPAQSQIFATALAEAGAQVSALPVRNAGHFWFSKESPRDSATGAASVAVIVLDFLRRNL